MRISFSEKLTAEIGVDALKALGLEKRSWRDEFLVDLRKTSASGIKKLQEFLLARKKIRGVPPMLKDIETWFAGQTAPAMQKPRSVAAFSSLAAVYLAQVPGHRLYRQNSEGNWLAHYVESIVFYDANERGSEVTPPFCVIKLAFSSLGKFHDHSIRLDYSDIYGNTIFETLANAGFYAENDELRKYYLTCHERFRAVFDKIGKQYLAVGYGVQNVNGNPGREHGRYWHSSRGDNIVFERESGPSRVVIDVFREGDTAEYGDGDEKNRPNNAWWCKYFDNLLDPEETDESETMTGDEHPEPVKPLVNEHEITAEIPVHPYVVVFDLQKHLRLSTHVFNLTDYVYDTRLSDKLIVSEETKNLIHILIEQKDGGFVDVVRGKGGGAIVLLTGPPGVGKTLTAEVFAECEQRPLYTVQCSQLGMDADTLEGELLKVFTRARRWKAVTLLDEADVYVTERGNSLIQNAIVGVFLRVLEYQASVLFFTSNRPDDIDDAIASRCLARINYKVPTSDEQEAIWKVMRGGFEKIDLTDAAIKRIVSKNPGISGRDVKNLLKLAVLLAKGKPIDVKEIEYVKLFRPVREVK